MSRPTASKAAPRKRKSSRQAVLVMGMHRSGTSALSGILGKLGVQPPRTLMPPTDDNPRGYWESTALMGFHDRLLRSAGSTWSDWDAFNPHWMESSVADTFRDRLPEVLEHEFGDAPLFLVKDPRISRFARFWLEALPALSIAPKVVICVRHPWEVAQSLEVRNDFGRKRAQLIWLRHMLDAEHATRGASRSFVHYGSLLQDWASQVRRLGKELDLPWPRWSSEVETEIDRFLTFSLRRNVAETSELPDDSELGTWVATSYRVLGTLAEGTHPTDKLLGQLDAVRRAFDKTSEIYGAVVREQELQAGERIESFGKDLAKETEQVAALRTQLDAAMQELDTARKTLAVRESEIASGTEANRSGEAERVRMHEEYQAAVSSLEDRLKEREAAAAASDATVQGLRAELEALGKERDAAATAAAASDATLQGLRAELEALGKERDAAATAAAASDATLQRLRAELEALRKEREAAAAAAAASDATVQGLRAELEALREAQLKSEAAVAERDAELARLGAARTVDAEQHTAVLAGERQAQAGVVARLCASHARELERLREGHAATLSQRDRAKAALEATLDERFDEIAHLSRLLLDQESKVEALEARLSRAEAEHERALGAQQEASEARLKDTIAVHERRYTEARAEHAVVVSGLKREAEEKQQALDLLQERMDKAVAIRESHYRQQSRKHAGELAEMAARHARELERREAQITKQQVHLDAVNRELQLHRNDIRRLSGELHAIHHSRSWQITALLRGESKAPPPEARPLHEQARIIRESGRFDAGWYLSGNPDVVASGMDPVLHYLEHGAREGRNPAPDFDTATYLRRHPGLAETGCNPLLHLIISAPAVAGTTHDEPGAREREPR